MSLTRLGLKRLFSSCLVQEGLLRPPKACCSLATVDESFSVRRLTTGHTSTDAYTAKLASRTEEELAELTSKGRSATEAAADADDADWVDVRGWESGARVVRLGKLAGRVAA